jgi:hypothetical protein
VIKTALILGSDVPKSLSELSIARAEAPQSIKNSSRPYFMYAEFPFDEEKSIKIFAFSIV